MSDFELFVGLAFMVGVYLGTFIGSWARARDEQARRREW